MKRVRSPALPVQPITRTPRFPTESSLCESIALSCGGTLKSPSMFSASASSNLSALVIAVTVPGEGQYCCDLPPDRSLEA